MKLYGGLQNRLEENRMFCDEIKVGTGVTEYFYTDRHAYEVIEVKDQKHVKIRRFDVKRTDNNGMCDCQNYAYTSNVNNPTLDLVRRGNCWYVAKVCTIETLNEYEDAYNNRTNPNLQIWFASNGFDKEMIRKNGKQTKYTKMNVSFGIADEHFDYSF